MRTKARRKTRRRTHKESLSFDKNFDENIKYLYLYPTQLDSLVKKNKDQKLNDIVTNFIKFKKEEQQMIVNNISIPHYDFKKTLFKQVELLLFQINEVDNQSERKKYIEKLYKWYKNKTRFYFTLNRMNEKSYFEPYEKYDINAMKNILKENEKKDEEEDKIDQKKDENKDKNNTNIHRPILLRCIKLIKIIENDIKPSKFYFRNKFGKNKSELNLLSKYEKNKSTEFERLKKNISTTSIDFNLNELKNKFISEKSHQNEIKSIIEDFGKSRAIYKSNLNKRFEIKKIIKEYRNKNIKNELVTKILNNNESNINKSNITNNNSNIINNRNNKNNNIENNIGNINEVKKQEDNLDNNSLEYIINEKEMNNLENEKEKKETETYKRRLNKIITNRIRNMSSDNLIISYLNKSNNGNDRYDNENKKRYIENRNRTKSALFLTSTEIYNDKEITKEGLEEKTINIYCQFPKIKSSNALISEKSKEYDTIMRNIYLDPIYRAKHHNSFICSLNNDRKKNFDGDNSYRNINDNDNNENNGNKDKDNILNFNNICEFTKKTLSKSIDRNYLRMKKGFDFLKKKEYLKLRNLMRAKRNYENINNSALFTAFTNPKSNVIYPNYFLPLNNGNNLLLKPLAK